MVVANGAKRASTAPRSRCRIDEYTPVESSRAMTDGNKRTERKSGALREPLDRDEVTLNRLREDFAGAFHIPLGTLRD